MPTKTFYLDQAATEAVTASWKWLYRDFQLTYQGQSLGSLTPAELKADRSFMLPDGRQLRVRLQQQFGAQGLDFQLDGRPLAGTVNDPLAQVKVGFWAIILIVGLNTVLSVIALAGSSEVLLNMGIGWGSLVEAGIYAGLGWLGRYRLAAWAFYTALGLLVIDGLLTLGSGNSSSGVIVRVLIGIAIFRAATAARQLRAEATATPVA